MPHDADGHLAFSAARFDKATFQGDARFSGATFQGVARFSGATFQGDARFDGATFQGVARFDGATFQGVAWFTEATFEDDDAWFSRATFKRGAGFSGATFQGDAWFTEATFKGRTGFDKATFEGDTWFGGATFKGSDTWFDGASFKGRTGFERATFEVPAGFNWVTFKGRAWFNWATFKGRTGFERATFEFAGFGEATFEGDTWFGGATFKSSAWFTEATFEDDAGFNKATFEGEARFSGATFKGYAGFAEATVKLFAMFDKATFEGRTRFDKATFSYAWFTEATFEDDAGFAEAAFRGDATFTEATFRGDVPVLGPIAVGGSLNLDGVQFTSTVRIEADASVLTCRRGRFPSGVRFDVRRALVRLDDSDLSAPSLLTAASSPAGITGQPRLFSLQRANVAGLVLGNVDLADCRFDGAHNLDKLRLEAGTTFGLSPAIAGWERRQVIAEEAAWRADRATPGRWSAPAWPDSDDKPKVLSPGAVAVLYRALRKSREDAKDEPGAADFYYGEMEMRRHDRGEGHASGGWCRGLVSRGVLTAYWLVSGYALRAWRSLAALVVVMAVSAAVFRLWGFTDSTSYWKSLLFAFRSTLSLDDKVTLTTWGGLFQAILRLTGPVLLALTLLALRGRVKR